MVFHALNRGVGKTRIYSTERDDAAFEETVEETLRLYPMRILRWWRRRTRGVGAVFGGEFTVTSRRC